MKLPYTAECSLEPSDQLEVDESYALLGGPGVAIYGHRNDSLVTSVHMSPTQARRLAKAIKKAAKRAEAAR